MFVKNWYKLIAAHLSELGVPVKRTTNIVDNITVAQGYEFKVGQDYFQCPSVYQPRFLHDTASFNSYSANGSNNSQGAGVYFGDGDTAPTIDDYTLAGEILNTATASASVTKTVDDNGVTITSVYTITNTGTSDFTIREIGLVYATYYHRYLVERTLLDEPVTIPAGGIGQVTYTIRFDYPTA